MSTTSILPSAPAAGTPRTPQAAATWRSRFRRAGLALWRGLEASGQARAERELRALHDRWELSDPARARQVRDAREFLVAQRTPHR
jgi:hypothetical protein